MSETLTDKVFSDEELDRADSLLATDPRPWIHSLRRSAKATRRENARLLEENERLSQGSTAEVERLRAQNERLHVEVAAFRAGLDVDSPACRLLIQTYSGPARPEAIREAFIGLTSSVLEQRLADGVSLHDLADEADGPTLAEREQQYMRSLLTDEGDSDRVRQSIDDPRRGRVRGSSFYGIEDPAGEGS